MPHFSPKATGDFGVLLAIAKLGVPGTLVPASGPRTRVNSTTARPGGAGQRRGGVGSSATRAELVRDSCKPHP